MSVCLKRLVDSSLLEVETITTGVVKGIVCSRSNSDPERKIEGFAYNIFKNFIKEVSPGEFKKFYSTHSKGLMTAVYGKSRHKNQATQRARNKQTPIKCMEAFVKYVQEARTSELTKIDPDHLLIKKFPDLVNKYLEVIPPAKQSDSLRRIDDGLIVNLTEFLQCAKLEISQLQKKEKADKIRAKKNALIQSDLNALNENQRVFHDIIMQVFDVLAFELSQPAARYVNMFLEVFLDANKRKITKKKLLAMRAEKTISAPVNKEQRLRNTIKTLIYNFKQQFLCNVEQPPAQDYLDKMGSTINTVALMVIKGEENAKNKLLSKNSILCLSLFTNLHGVVYHRHLDAYNQLLEQERAKGSNLSILLFSLKVSVMEDILNKEFDSVISRYFQGLSKHLNDKHLEVEIEGVIASGLFSSLAYFLRALKRFMKEVECVGFFATQNELVNGGSLAEK